MGEGSGRFWDGQEELGEVYRSYLKKVCQTDGQTWEGLEVLPHLKRKNKQEAEFVSQLCW